MLITTRPAIFNDIPVLQQLIAESVCRLSKGYYTETQIESSIKYIFGVDTQLLIDETYYVAETGNQIIACGGWSKRETLYGGDQHKAVADPLLDPATDAARIRAFFVHPDWARQGIGKMMINLCEAEAIKNGFKAMELGATLPGEPLYRAMGYKSLAKILVDMANGEQLDVIKMRKEL
ncbi:Acetyltransferase (GNAT) domain-containing protein [Mucilaginibacter mallensis]|uniref:Acetyltransferase (GNAT) domain-containing protein n=1 Tax=Mucilaginibacter mallensis TaxID=652787 RepID=A0A1H2B9P1_MUCMA|nr:GNAT family N-acetyltransferase [Mucilaginibacter mallensis]SDT54908.1 Acetyltransferase (GNAT) domain-containing protein [Mucilaginibacter mallensis]